MDESQSESIEDLLTVDGEEEHEKGEEENLQPDPGYRELEPGDNSKFHDSIKAEDWDESGKLIRRYKSHYYKKKRIEAREMEKKKLQEEEEENASRSNEEKEKEKEELTKFQRIRRHVPFINKRTTSKIRTERRTTTIAKKVLPLSVTKKMFVDPAEIISPLLMVDSDGRTPLHLAFIHKAPVSIILDIFEAEKKASSMKDHACQLPLHSAILSWQHDHVIERIVKACPNALRNKDNEGRTPVGLAVELAIQGRHKQKSTIEDPDDPFLWIHPTSKKETNWQFEQEMRWSKVNCLLRELINRRKSLIPSEHGLILDALEQGADPNTIVRFITASDRYLMADDELAAAAIGLCVDRHYNVGTLEYLLENCRDNTTVITDIVQKAIQTHYAMGCYPLREGMVPLGKRVIDWAKKQQREEKQIKKKAMKKNIDKKKKGKDKSQRGESHKKVSFKDIVDEKDDDNKKKKWTGMKAACKDWWQILNHLLFYCAYGRDYENNIKPKTFHLVHAAVSAPMTPPSLVHLLLIVYPESIYEKCPVYNVLPVHILCTRWRYDIVYSDSDVSSLDQVLLHLYESDPDLLNRRHKGSLPVHMALFGGQFWAFVKSLISTEKKVLGMRDAQSRLFPFQIAALPIRFQNIQLLMRCQFNSTTWREMAFLEKQIEYERVVNEHKTRQLSTIFELLRRYPDAIENRLLTKDPSTAFRSLRSRSLSELSMHYLSWIYSRNSEGGYEVRYDNLTSLRDSIVQAQILPKLELWWNELKQCIWNDSHGDTPRTNDYLLHLALYNCETPPLVTELLIQLFPSSTTKPIPGTSIYPLHIAAGTTSYQRQQFEIPYGMNNLRLVLKAYKQAARFKSNERLPLHICLAKGKSWKEVHPLIMIDPSSLKVKDGQTGLLPFELMASFKLSAKENSWFYSALTEKQMKTFSFDQLSSQEKAKVLARARKKKELSQLNCIFELLRHRPSVLSLRYSGFTVNSDDDSVTSLYSLVDDGYEMRGGVQPWETLADSRSETLNNCSLHQSQGSSRGLLSPIQSNMKSIHSLYDGDDAPPLITSFNASDNSLSALVFDKSSSDISSSRPNSTVKIMRGRNKTKSSFPISKPKFERRLTKMSLFDFNDLDLFDDDQSSESSNSGGK